MVEIVEDSTEITSTILLPEDYKVASLKQYQTVNILATAPHSLDYEMSTLPMGALSQSGVFGDATVATVEKGERWFNACVTNIVKVWREFLDLPGDESNQPS